jgi:hypothetical protein
MFQQPLEGRLEFIRYRGANSPVIFFFSAMVNPAFCLHVRFVTESMVFLWLDFYVSDRHGLSLFRLLAKIIRCPPMSLLWFSLEMST